MRIGTSSPGNGVADDDVGQTRDADAGDSQLQHRLRRIGDHVAADMDDADALVSVEGPTAQRWQAGDPQAVVLLQIIWRARRAAALQIVRRRADDALQVADAARDHRRFVERADADRQVDAVFQWRQRRVSLIVMSRWMSGYRARKRGIAGASWCMPKARAAVQAQGCHEGWPQIR